MKRIYLGTLAILGTFAIALPSAKPVSLYVTQVMHNERIAEADRLFKLGEQQLKSNQPSSALEYFQKALPIYQQIKERLAEGHTYKSIGNAYYFLKDYQRAISHQQQALTIAREIKNSNLEARALLNLGVVNAAQENLPLAIDYYQQSLAIVRSTGYANTRSSQNREIEQKALSTVKTTIELLEKNLVNVRDTKDKRREINILVSLGQAFITLGDNSKAIASFEQASAIARELKDTQLQTAVLQRQAQALGQISNSYFIQKDYTKAIKYSEQLRALSREIKNPYFEVVALGLLANSYQITGELPTVVNLREEQQKIFDKNQDPWVALLQGGELAILCDNYWLLEDYSQAISCYEKGLKIVQKYQNNQDSAIKNSNNVAEFRYVLGLGIVYQKVNKPQKSINFLDSAYAIYQGLKNSPFLSNKQYEISIFKLLGLNYWAIGDTNKAIDYFKQQLSISSSNIVEQVNANNSLGGAYFAQSKYDVSLEYFNQAIKIAKKIKTYYLSYKSIEV